MARFHTRGRQHFSVGNCARPFAAILAVPGNPWMTQGLRSVFGVAAPEEIVKVS